MMMKVMMEMTNSVGMTIRIRRAMYVSMPLRYLLAGASAVNGSPGGRLRRPARDALLKSWCLLLDPEMRRIHRSRRHDEPVGGVRFLNVVEVVLDDRERRRHADRRDHVQPLG